jgi:acyl-coenzyme A thioesterase PaaI-like protein
MSRSCGHAKPGRWHAPRRLRYLDGTMAPFPEDQDLVFPADGGCFGCSQTNASGLRLRFRRRGDVVLARYTIPDRFHGAPGIAHGGIVATILDEVSCAAIFFVRERPVVTGELTVRYLRPCPVGRELAISARVTDDGHARYLVVEGEVRDGETPLARSIGRFFESDPRRRLGSGTEGES